MPFNRSEDNDNKLFPKLKKTNFFQKQFSIKVIENSNKVGKLTFLQALPKIFIEMVAS